MSEYWKFSEFVHSYRNGFGRRPDAGEIGPIVLRIADVSSGFIDLSNPRCGNVSANEAKTYQLTAGDLLFVRVNGAREIVGRCAVVNDRVPASTIFNDHLIRVQLKPGLDPEFVRYCMSSTATRSVIEEAASTSAGQLTINQQLLDSIEIPAHPLDEQRRIAARLKTQLTAVEDARQAAQAQAADARRLIPAILESAFAEVTDAPRVRLGDLAKTTSGSTPSRDRKEYWQPPTYPWVKTGEVLFRPIFATEESISETALKECSLTLLPPGTVLVAMYGQGKTRGQSAVLRVTATTNQACFAILPGESHHPDYLQFWLWHSYAALRALSEARGGNQSNLNGEILNQFEMPLVPLAQQRTIAERIAAAISEAVSLSDVIGQRLADINRLPARLLAQAFAPSDQEASP